MPEPAETLLLFQGISTILDFMATEGGCPVPHPGMICNLDNVPHA